MAGGFSHPRGGGAHPPAPRPQPAGVRLPRGVARLHGRRRGLPLRSSSGCWPPPADPGPGDVPEPPGRIPGTGPGSTPMPPPRRSANLPGRHRRREGPWDSSRKACCRCPAGPPWRSCSPSRLPRGPGLLGLVLPGGELALPLGGVLASQGRVPLAAALAVGTAGALAGDSWLATGSGGAGVPACPPPGSAAGSGRLGSTGSKSLLAGWRRPGPSGRPPQPPGPGWCFPGWRRHARAALPDLRPPDRSGGHPLGGGSRPWLRLVPPRLAGATSSWAAHRPGRQSPLGLAVAAGLAVAWLRRAGRPGPSGGGRPPRPGLGSAVVAVEKFAQPLQPGGSQPAGPAGGVATTGAVASSSRPCRGSFRPGRSSPGSRSRASGWPSRQAGQRRELVGGAWWCASGRCAG